MTTKREIKATPNHSARTFTLRVKHPDGDKSTYRTVQLSKDEFQSCLNNTENDWQQFLNSSDYYRVR